MFTGLLLKYDSVQIVYKLKRLYKRVLYKASTNFSQEVVREILNLAFFCPFLPFLPKKGTSGGLKGIHYIEH